MEEYKNAIEIDIKNIGDVKLLYDPPSNNCQISSRLSKNDYFEKVTNILKHIHRGDIYEVNYCQEFYLKRITLTFGSLASPIGIEPISLAGNAM